MRRSIPQRIEPELGPAIWHDANGYEWGYIGQDGERLDQKGLPLAEQNGTSARNGCLILVLALLAAMVLVWYLLFSPVSPPHPGGPSVPPTTYGPPGSNGGAEWHPDAPEAGLAEREWKIPDAGAPNTKGTWSHE